jgi:hypothetical protein
MQPSAFIAPLADEHQDELRRQASEFRLAHGSRPNGRRRQRSTTRWWRPATRSTQA